jgi:hydrogenase maturation protease
MPASKILIVGIGNPGRGDDGLGPALIARLAALPPDSLPEGRIIEFPGGKMSGVWKYQLNVEDALTIRDFDAVVFADAAAQGDDPVAFKEIHPAAAIAFTTHELSPAAVLALSEELYGRAPQGFVLAMRGSGWQLGESLSVEASRHLQAALDGLSDFLSGVDSA